MTNKNNSPTKQSNQNKQNAKMHISWSRKFIHWQIDYNSKQNWFSCTFMLHLDNATTPVTSYSSNRFLQQTACDLLAFSVLDIGWVWACLSNGPFCKTPIHYSKLQRKTKHSLTHTNITASRKNNYQTERKVNHFWDCHGFKWLQ